MVQEILVLAPIVLFSFTIQAMTGFGSVVIALTLAALLFPIPRLLPILVALNLPLCVYIVVKQWHSINWKALVAVFPLMTVGLGIGVVLTPMLDGPLLRKVFGAIVVLFALREIFLLVRGRPVVALSGPVFQAWMLTSGVVHGLYASGGPPLVYALSRRIADKGVFRASLMFVWLVFNVVLFAVYLLQGRWTAELSVETGILLATIPIGLWAGEFLHHRVPDRAFRLTVQVTLVLAGGALFLK